MEQHMKILGILNIVYASFGVMVALVIFAIFGGSADLVAANNDPDAATAIPILGAIGLLIMDGTGRLRMFRERADSLMMDYLERMLPEH